jgi:hypothetical protein
MLVRKLVTLGDEERKTPQCSLGTSGADLIGFSRVHFSRIGNLKDGDSNNTRVLACLDFLNPREAHDIRSATALGKAWLARVATVP